MRSQNAKSPSPLINKYLDNFLDENIQFIHEVDRERIKLRIIDLINREVVAAVNRGRQEGFYYGYKQGLENKPPIFAHKELEKFLVKYKANSLQDSE